MNSLGKLALLLILVAVVAASACWTTSHFLVKTPPPQGDYHHWLHTQLGITADQDKALDKEEERFASQRKDLVAMIQQDNAELATAMMQDKEFSPRVAAAVEEIHHGQSELEKATLEHIFAMKPILSPEQFDKLLKLTSDALNNPSDL
jgi:Spy/CpxP family protein refolding chaperone